MRGLCPWCARTHPCMYLSDAIASDLNNGKGIAMSMQQSSANLIALIQSKVAVDATTTKRKTLKGQRKAVETKTHKVKVDGHTCSFNEQAVKPTPFAKCPVCMAFTNEFDSLPATWSLPVAFDLWSKHQGHGYSSVNAALDAGQGQLVVAYDRYVRSTFNEAVSFGDGSAFDKVVRRQNARQLQGFADLGLLGYSASDVVDLAVLYAWVDRIKVWLLQTGADDETASAISQALRDLRSDDELRDDAKLGQSHRYTFGTDGRLRKQDNELSVRKARKFLAARRLVKLYPVWAYATDWLPSVGSVYRQVGHVMKEGLREFRNIKEGLTRDGHLSDAVQFISIEVGDIVEPVIKSVEDTYFEAKVFEEVQLEREVILNEYLSRPALLPTEAAALTVAALLNNGESLLFIREQFDTEVAFRRAIADAQQLFAA